MTKSMKEMQKEVDAYISQFKAGYFSPLANLARLTEEVGELAREINHYYGEKQKKDSEEDNTVKAELGDNLFVLLCIANSLNIDMTDSFNETMKSLIHVIKTVLSASLDVIGRELWLNENWDYMLPINGWLGNYCYRTRH